MRLGTLLTCLLLGHFGFAQDPISSQIFSNPINLNPAFAGFEGSSRIVTTYRNQWPEVGPFHRFDFSYDQSSRHLHGGFSFRYQYDHGNGAFKTHTISHAYSPTFRLFKKQLVVSPAFETSYIFRTIDPSRLTHEELIAPVYGYVYPADLLLPVFS
jgi:hypothetical protein